MNTKLKTALIWILFLIPASLGAVVSLFLIVFYDAIFGYSILSGALISTLIGSVIGFLIFFGIKILKKIAAGSFRNAGLAKFHYILSGIAFIALFTISWIVLPYVTVKNYHTGPMLTWGSNQDPQTEITIVWRTRGESTATINFGTDPENLNSTVLTLNPEKWHKVPITGLQPGTKYYYQVEGVTRSRIYSFTTAPDTETSFTFLSFSDPRQNSGRIGMLLERSVPKYMVKDMKKQGITPAFTICIGDTVSNALDEPLWNSWFDDITTRTGLASNAPLQIAVGNHERHENCTGEIFADRYPYDSHPQFYYAFNYSSTNFLMLDPWNETSCDWGGVDASQLAWVEENLINSTSMKYKVISLHPPPLFGDHVFEELQPLIDLCDTYDVDAVFFGHWHSFGHWTINGTEYILNGVGGNNGKNAGPSGFCQIDVESTSMAISMLWLNGTIEPIAIILA